MEKVRQVENRKENKRTKEKRSRSMRNKVDKAILRCHEEQQQHPDMYKLYKGPKRKGGVDGGKGAFFDSNSSRGRERKVRINEVLFPLGLPTYVRPGGMKICQRVLSDSVPQRCYTPCMLQEPRISQIS